MAVAISPLPPSTADPFQVFIIGWPSTGVFPPPLVTCHCPSSQMIHKGSLVPSQKGHLGTGLHSAASAATACCVLSGLALVLREGGGCRMQQVVVASVSWKAGKEKALSCHPPSNHVECLEIHQPGTGNLEGAGWPATRSASFKLWDPGFTYQARAQFVELIVLEAPASVLGKGMGDRLPEAFVRVGWATPSESPVALLSVALLEI